MAEVEAHIIAHGRVQGVFYRASLQREARTRGVCGWVRNLPDGSVEALLQGPDEAVSAVLAWARSGPRGALVEAVEVSWAEPYIPFSGFEVRD